MYSHGLQNQRNALSVQWPAMVKYNTSIPTGFPFLFFSCFVQVIKTIYKTWPSLVFYFASNRIVYLLNWLTTMLGYLQQWVVKSKKECLFLTFYQLKKRSIKPISTSILKRRLLKRGAEEISPENGKLTDLKGGSTFFLLLPSFFFTESSGIETGVGVLLL